MLPKYFKNLHLMISVITGTPRIVSIDTENSQLSDKIQLSDKYIDIPKEEWEGSLIHYFDSFQEGKRQLLVIDNWSFFLGGNATSREHLIRMLEDAIEEVKTLK